MIDSDTRFVTPAPDRRVRHADGALLDPAGEPVTWSTYWERRRQDGDVLIGAPKKKEG
ncbi:DUF2635 domain-containing protein [Sphingomonas naphthae]|uniref:DUF2635 domain-containing protein n=1 Tax=Sphingomonas naphthae TaxID=1813468 RepID=A0ABY7THZ4_9SPHN|nr:DUF2635 domain-containing protein [Sphingomonas naphthae]WCT72055.1 DUF2635 domain-containing protein [Sphingomonas naphthae]